MKKALETTVMIAHRLGTGRFCDRVTVRACDRPLERAGSKLARGAWHESRSSSWARDKVRNPLELFDAGAGQTKLRLSVHRHCVIESWQVVTTSGSGSRAVLRPPEHRWCQEPCQRENPILSVNAPDVRPPAAVGWRRQRLSQLRLSDAAQTEMLSALGCGWGVVLDWSRPLMIFLVGLGRGGR